MDALGKAATTLILSFIASMPMAPAGAKPGADNGESRVERDFDRMDIDGDGRVGPAEWLRRGNFERLDTDGDGFLSYAEILVLYRHSLPESRPFGSFDVPPVPDGGIDSSALSDRVSRDTIGRAVLCGILRGRGCEPETAMARGMIATGLGPRFPDGASCHAIDDYWALDYAYKRGRQNWHGGIDLPAAWGTPMRAAAHGTVVAVFEGAVSARGKEVVLRHAPEQTGLPFWTYTGYGHLDALPPFEPGQRVRRGQILGPTGNTGLGGMTRVENTARRAAIHFSVMFAESPLYTIDNETVVPVDGYWMDPVAFYRPSPPYASEALKDLPDSEKYVAIPIMYEDGRFLPADTRRIWPYACKPD